jgi:hypothetical protein
MEEHLVGAPPRPSTDGIAAGHSKLPVAGSGLLLSLPGTFRGHFRRHRDACALPPAWTGVIWREIDGE